ncbi:hypothetical protein AURDEDRAFT_173414 [Auricularia subglabra TFB-10046 SS5]|uniref:DUF6534 domain-containing protein n=1 Tax=Auricularia subglabra (strain TFB-10046 / SS5) TaxID=717982 RepID=J0DAS8_AURST|nr:hypothetical protein AURDEDRAFT_173414 [Auricularia subglabra TFB-10046 SS5]
MSVAPWMIGCFLDLFTQGILLCQFNNYFTWYKDDKGWLRCAVFGLVVLTGLKCLNSCATTWIAQVEYFGDLDGAVLLNYVAWWQSGAPLMGATINFYVQAYFVFRLQVISKRHWVVLPVAAVVLFAWLSCVIATIYIKLQDSKNIQHWFAAHLGSAFAADFLMTVSTATFLMQSRKNSLRQTQNLIDTLVRLTWQSAAPAAACATVNLILSQAVPGQYIVSTIFNLLLPKLYSISMMWTVNSRKDVRLVSASGKTSSSEGATGTRRGTRRDDLELGRLGTIQVHKQTETIQRVDWAVGAHDSAEDVKDGGYFERQPTSTIQEERADGQGK